MPKAKLFMKNFYTIIALSALLFSACEMNENAEETPMRETPVNFTLSINKPTKAGATSFEDSDNIGMYAVKHTDDSEAAFLGVRQIENVKYTISGGMPESEAPVYFPKKNTTTDFYLYYPWVDYNIDLNSTYLKMKYYYDQSIDDNFKKCDLMVAAALGVETSPIPIHFQFKRLMSKIEFRLKPGTGYTGSELEKAEFLIKNICTDGSLNMVEQTIEGISSLKDITPHGKLSFDSWDDITTGIDAIIYPQTVKKGTALYMITLGDRKFRGTLPEDITFEAGKKYVFTTTLNRVINGDEIMVTPTIEDWDEGADFSGSAGEIDPDDDINFITDIDGNEYSIVTLGTQKWLGENLRTTTLNNGTPISHIQDQSDWDNCENTEEAAWCNYDNSPQNGQKYGLLYNWYAAAKTNICPEGWHVATMDDWKTLNNFLGENAGTKLKSKTETWYDINNETNPAYQGTDEFGFNALPCGNRRFKNGFERIGMYGEWWTANQHEQYGYSAYVWFVYAKYNDLRNLYHVKEVGHAIRCVKD